MGRKTTEIIAPLMVGDLRGMRISPDPALFSDLHSCTLFVIHWSRQKESLDSSRSLFVDALAGNGNGNRLPSQRIAPMLCRLLTPVVLADALAGHDVNLQFSGATQRSQEPKRGLRYECDSNLARLGDHLILCGQCVAFADKPHTTAVNSFGVREDGDSALDTLQHMVSLLARSFSKFEQDAKDGCVRSMELAVVPLIDSMDTESLTPRQRAWLELMKQDVSAITLDYFSKTDVPAVLSNRELEVLELIRQGRTSKEIAELLCISRRTVDSRRDSIRRKLGVKGSGNSLNTLMPALPKS